MYVARLSQSELLDFHLMENLATARARVIELTTDSVKFMTQGSFNLDVLNHCDVTSDELSDEKAGRDKLHTYQLVVLSESLNLEKLNKIHASLSDRLTLNSWYVQPRATGLGVVAKADVTLNNDHRLKTEIDDIANAYRVELALLNNPPVLAEGGLMVMDMDSTLIAVECIDEIAKLAGMGEKVASVTEQAMQGKLDFAKSLHNRVECLTGVEESLLEGIRDRLPLMPGVTKLLSHMQRNGWQIVIASGGFTYFADYLRDRLGMYEAVSNTLEVRNGRLTGKIVGDVVDANVKAKTLERLAVKLNVPTSQTIAVGDGANDLVMMSSAAMGVAYHAKPVVREKATAAIRFGGLDTLLDFLA